MPTQTHGDVRVDNVLHRYREEIADVLAECGQTAKNGAEFNPGVDLPPVSEELTAYFAASSLSFRPLGEYRGKELRLLDLMGNPRTRTTKTFASLLIVARAVEYIRRTHERVMIVSPSSGNKATALRDAVLRAHEHGLASPEQLNILTVVPTAAAGKLWASALSENEWLRLRNPMVVMDAADRSAVKPLARALVDQYGASLRERYGVNLWFTLDIDNYKAADIVRACAEYEFLPPTRSRLHVHAVSSAFGLLGHHLGTQRIAAAAASPPHYFLVQHLDTPDMVLSLHFGSPSRDNLPRYRYDAASGLYHQESDPRFPARAYHPEENLDPTFYTRRPTTSPAMDALIRTQGGGGIVVSLPECFERYPLLRALLADAGITLPHDPRALREWSLVMALTGILNAVDRGLVPEDDILVHGSGSYTEADFSPIPAPHLAPVGDLGALAELAGRAALGKDGWP
ncbi:DUF6002 family protein [Streptomyces sp. NRRL B-1347]|uniref:DUF6002 family protein n=1 Tax=Streptomyces sp. NRRL B-1347 TaxID=1476877 RepID=UPI0004C9910A|nr:DUF6002 family protein [Streptomyces sp. NRRL B-1347]